MIRSDILHRTRTEVVTIPSQEAPATSAQLEVHAWGQGTVLWKNTENPLQGQPLSVSHESVVHDALSRIVVQGKETKIQRLFTQIQSAMIPPELRQTIDEWIVQFQRIDIRRDDERALSLAIFIIRVLRPAVLESKLPELQSRLFDWEDICLNIIQQMNTGGLPVERFLEECEIGLLEEKLFHERCERADCATRIFNHALTTATEELSSRIQRIFVVIREQLSIVQSSRKEMCRNLSAELASIELDVQRMRERTLDQVRGVTTLYEQERLVLQEIEAQTEKCKNILSELI